MFALSCVRFSTPASVLHNRFESRTAQLADKPFSLFMTKEGRAILSNTSTDDMQLLAHIQSEKDVCIAYHAYDVLAIKNRSSPYASPIHQPDAIFQR